MESCPRKWQAACPRRNSKEGCVRRSHHIFYPASGYETKLEKQFRNLPENRVDMCRQVEEQIHRLQPEGPPKPTQELMQHCVGQRAIKLALQQEGP